MLIGSQRALSECKCRETNGNLSQIDFTWNYCLGQEVELERENWYEIGDNK
jgi:hypothetical protein